ncbi:uncharacterized protein LOC124350089 [Daphnia pulicaria]|uniref:uncharacterized protein LOC124350089 n=1 Tax=Daphnia pulicaria TaxID=35523 RepID=UPI001EEB235D|nr:uncharacterized protein LOC124350089 [Daphnia pulicaria]
MRIQLFTWLVMAAVLLVVASAGNIPYSALTYKQNKHAAKPSNFKFPSDDVYSTGYRRIFHPDGRIQIVSYVTDAKHESERKYQENRPVAAYPAPAYRAPPTTPRPYVTTTSAPFYPAPISHVVISPPYGQTVDFSSPYDDPTYVTSNVDLSTLFRETASRKFLRH